MSGRTRNFLRGLASPGDHASAPFCGHCGQAPAGALPSRSRVCVRCDMGLILHADAAVAPSPGEPFLIVSPTLTVCAVSQLAEQLLRVTETQAVHRHVMDFLVPADDGVAAGDDLLTLLAGAAAGAPGCRWTTVRPATEHDQRHEARIGWCGPPPAAVIVLADASPRAA